MGNQAISINFLLCSTYLNFFFYWPPVLPDIGLPAALEKSGPSYYWGSPPCRTISLPNDGKM
jgi:hypothetical protein